MISGQISPAIMQETLCRSPNHEATGPNGVQGLVLKHMSPVFHEALLLPLQASAIAIITLPSWLKSHTILLYKKEDPTRLGNYYCFKLFSSLFHHE
jgi:hypothetical protein